MEDKPIILITPPEVIVNIFETFNDGIVEKTEYDYTKSHLIYKGYDLGTFEEIAEYKYMINSLNAKIEHLENDYYHALSLITGHEYLSKRKKKLLEEEYETYKIIRVNRILERGLRKRGE